MATKLFTLLAVAVAVLTSTGAESAGDRLTVEYSADQVIEAEEAATKSRIHATPSKERREMNQGGMTMIMIRRHDKKVTWTLMPEEKMYMEAAMQAASSDKTDLSAYRIEHTPVGQETLNGQNLNKSKIIMTHSDGSKMGGFMWTTQDGILAKIDAISVEDGRKDRFKMEQTNIKVGKQPADLFEIPAGFEKMDMGGMGMDMLKGMMGR